MTTMFENSQWRVTDDGLEAVPAEGGYLIEAERLVDSTNAGNHGMFYDWPLHMAEKTWVNVDSFIEAFEKALEIHKGRYSQPVDREMLAASYAMAHRIAARRGMTTGEIYLDMVRELYEEGRDPGHIPERHAAVFWDQACDASDSDVSGIDMRITELRVVDIRDRKEVDRCGRFANSRGAVCAEWLSGPQRETARGLFLELITLEGFVSDEVKIKALREFAKIEGQPWAVQFLAELGQPIVDDDAE